jgi:hypothetical protein
LIARSTISIARSTPAQKPRGLANKTLNFGVEVLKNITRYNYFSQI